MCDMVLFGICSASERRRSTRLALEDRLPKTEFCSRCPNVTAAIAEAVKRRHELLSRSDTDAVRLLHGEADGTPGVTADRLGPVVLIERHVEDAPAEALVGPLATEFGMNTPVFLKERWSREREFRAGRQVFGGDIPSDIVVREAGLQYRVRLTHEEHIGFFLDARPAREAARRLGQGRRVLNLFAYTCSLSVAAAAGGARSTTNVDAMRSALELGQENYTLNRLPTDSRTFLRNDVFQHLARAVSGRGRYDLVILDPPPRGRRRGGGYFELHEALPGLLSRAAHLLDESGLLLVGHNLKDLGDDELQALIREAGFEEPELLPTPTDFPLGSDRPVARFAVASLANR